MSSFAEWKCNGQVKHTLWIKLWAGPCYVRQTSMEPYWTIPREAAGTIGSLRRPWTWSCRAFSFGQHQLLWHTVSRDIGSRTASSQVASLPALVTARVDQRRRRVKGTARTQQSHSIHRSLRHLHSCPGASTEQGAGRAALSRPSCPSSWRRRLLQVGAVRKTDKSGVAIAGVRRLRQVWPIAIKHQVDGALLCVNGPS